MSIVSMFTLFKYETVWLGVQYQIWAIVDAVHVHSQTTKITAGHWLFSEQISI